MQVPVTLSSNNFTLLSKVKLISAMSKLLLNTQQATQTNVKEIFSREIAVWWYVGGVQSAVRVLS